MQCGEVWAGINMVCFNEIPIFLYHAFDGQETLTQGQLTNPHRAHADNIATKIRKDKEQNTIDSSTRTSANGSTQSTNGGTYSPPLFILLTC